jgi:hypothetical protein
VGNLDRSEVLGVECSALIIGPSESSVVRAEDPLDELDLFWQKEILPDFHCIATLLSDTTGRREIRRTSGKRKQVRERIGVITSDDTEVLRKGCSDGSCLVSNLLVRERRHRGRGFDRSSLK